VSAQFVVMQHIVPNVKSRRGSEVQRTDADATEVFPEVRVREATLDGCSRSLEKLRV
jgi:hypothetical protein